jgi:hypothetical protein
MEKGRELPAWYLDEPELLPADGFYLRAFGELNTCRGAAGFGLPDIPWSAIVQYGYHVGLEDDMIEPFTVVIRRMDEAYRRWYDAETERRSRRSETESKPGEPRHVRG